MGPPQEGNRRQNAVEKGDPRSSEALRDKCGIDICSKGLVDRAEAAALLVDFDIGVNDDAKQERQSEGCRDSKNV